MLKYVEGVQAHGDNFLKLVVALTELVYTRGSYYVETAAVRHFPGFVDENQLPPASLMLVS